MSRRYLAGGLCTILLCIGIVVAEEKEPMIVAGEFVKIYDPSVGEDRPWYINDHCFIYGADGLWRLFGITHPDPASALQERIFAHATAKDLMQIPWDKQAPALAYAPEAPWNEEHLWAPHVIDHEGTYYMYYCAGDKDHSAYKLHLATSKDLANWTRHPNNPIVVDGFDARDPFVMKEGDQWLLYYTATTTPTGGHFVVACVTSTDLVNWGDKKVVYTDPTHGTYGGPTESPFVVRRGEKYFLFMGPRPDYDGTEVFVSDHPFGWKIEDKVGFVPAHAAEVIRDTDGKWYISRAGWGRGGVYLAPLTWQDGQENPETNMAVPAVN